MTKKILASLLLLGVFVPAFAFAQDLPQNTQEAQQMLEKGVAAGEKEIPGAIKKMWEEDVLPIWGKMFTWTKVHIWPTISSWFNKEVKPSLEGKGKEMIKNEANKEAQEMKQELPKVGKSVWDKFLEILNQ